MSAGAREGQLRSSLWTHLNQPGPSRSESLEGPPLLLPRSGDSRAPFAGSIVRGGNSAGTPTRSNWLTSQILAKKKKPVLTLEGIYRPQIPQEASHLHKPSALFNLQLLVLPGGNSNH